MHQKNIKELEKSLQKCLRPKEKPFKKEHIDMVVVKTYELNSAEHIWTFALQQKLTLDRNITFKFCCLMHKVLHEGHPNVLRDSLKYKEKLMHCAEYWSRQNDHTSTCLSMYCKVLHTKILFHQTYTSFKGNFQLDYDLPLRDINIWYLSIEYICEFVQSLINLFDYLEDLLHLQRVIFVNMQRDQISAASKKGMCRLASLVTIIAECNLLYQHSIIILRLLHSQLSPNDISGLSERFKEIFEELKSVHEYVRLQQVPLHYLVIPELPTLPPNLCTFDERQQEPTAPLISDLN